MAFYDKTESDTIVAFDTETTGAYPVTWEIIEIGGVKWRGGEVVDRFEVRIKPKGPMNPAAERVHGISLEELESSPQLEPQMEMFGQFIEGARLVAHHAPFDLGFLADAFEVSGLALPTNEVYCTSLLTRSIFPKSPNHKLGTLVEFLGVEKLTAHEAYADSKMCLDIFLKCLESGKLNSWEDVRKKTGKDLSWQRYSIESLKEDLRLAGLVIASRERCDVKIVYMKGSRPNTERTVKALGIVRSPDGDFFCGQEKNNPTVKRYYLEHIKSSEAIL